MSSRVSVECVARLRRVAGGCVGLLACAMMVSCASTPAEPIDASLTALTNSHAPVLTRPGGGTPSVSPGVKPNFNPGSPDLAALAQSVADIENLDLRHVGSRSGTASSPTRRTTPTPAPDSDTTPNLDLARHEAGAPTPTDSTRPGDVAVPSMDLASMTNGTGEPSPHQPDPTGVGPVQPGDAIGVAKALTLGLGVQPTPATALHALGTLESMSPGFVQRLEDPTSDERHALTEDEVRTLRQARDLVLTNDQARAQASESLLSALGLPPSGPQFRVPKAELCTKVRSFGVYTPLPSTTFLAGYPARAIVYTEVAGFTARDLEGSNGLRRVELSQRLSLYSDADGLEVWKVRERSVTETARTPRTDFYLVQEIALPVNLSVGKYTLKLTVSDKNSGALAQASIPITIVADPSLARRR